MSKITVMKVAIVHDYLKEFGGGERVLRVLSDMYPQAPIYTAFKVSGSTADKEFKDRKIIESFLAPILKIWRLYSPLRFLIPLVWQSMDLSNYDMVITSASSYIARGFKVGRKTKVVCYCHTPPRWLYGYEMASSLTKYWPIRFYAAILSHFMRMYDYRVSQGIDCWIANSKNVQARIKKFYRKDSVVIYPPVDIERISKETKGLEKEDYYFLASRQVGAKGINEAREIFARLNKKLIIAGEGSEIGRLSDSELYKTYAKARGFVALAREEDFGMTVVEAQAAGTPVIAFSGGGFLETVIDGKTGILVDDTKKETIRKAIDKLEKTNWNKQFLWIHAKKFSKERFVIKLRNLISSL